MLRAGFSSILTRFEPLLSAHGLTEENIRTLLVDNPAQALSFLPITSLEIDK
jgi:predicted metal-dependent phosphotriesterase family hydrolase